MAFGGLKGTLSKAANSITNPTDATGSVVVAIGDLVYAVVGEQIGVTATAVTDDLGNSYAALQAGTDAGTSTGRAFYSRVTAAGTLTVCHVAATGSTQNVAIVVAVIEGPFVVSPLDANPTQISSDITSPFTCPATGTLAQATEVVMAWGVGTGSTVWAATSPNLLALNLATQSVLKVAVGYQAVAATTSVSPAFTAAANPNDAVLGTSSFKGLATDALLADDVESASEVSTPSVGQAHVLDATDVQSTSEVTQPAIGQVHALLAAGIERASEVTLPALTEVVPLLADDVESASEVSTPALAGVHVLLAGDAESASEVSAPALAEAGTGGTNQGWVLMDDE